MKFRPYSRLPGTKVLLPGSSLLLTLYPTLIEVEDCITKAVGSIYLHLLGPVIPFTVFLDLDRGFVQMEMESKEGFLRLRLLRGLKLQLEKGPLKGVTSTFPMKKEGNEWLFETGGISQNQPPRERLSFGCHKQQDFELVKRRADLREILPFLFLAGSWVPGGGASLPTDDLLEWFLVQFSGIVAPRLVDEDHRGAFWQIPQDRLALLKGTALAIRSLFVQESHGTVSLFPQFHCGSLINVALESADLYLEWTKNKLFKVRLYGKKSGSFHLRFPKEIHSCRMNGQCFLNGGLITLDVNECLTLDRFQH